MKAPAAEVEAAAGEHKGEICNADKRSGLGS